MTVFDQAIEEMTADVARALDDAEIPYAIGGAIALGYYGEPRATVDIDVNIFVGIEKVDETVEILRRLRVDITAKSIETLRRDGQARLRWGRYVLDIFLSTDAFHESCAKRVRRVPFARADEIAILSCEDLIIFKLLYNRPKDWLDIEQVLFAQAGAFDIGYVEHWLEELIGRDDDRLKRLSQAIRTVTGRTTNESES